ncbi:MAG: hypothetical protein WDO19_02860 [Bacteroidota bacterium]
MKKSILCLIILLFTAADLLTCYHSQAQPSPAINDTVPETNRYVLKTRSGLTQIQNDSLAVLKSDTLSLWEKFRKQSIEKIKDNENRIAELKTSIANGGDGVKLSYQKTINEAERKNDSLRNRLDYYTDEKNEKLELFKQKFNDDINAITKSLRSIKIKSN